MLDELKSRIPEFNIFRNLNLAGKIFFIAVPFLEFVTCIQ